MYNVRKGWPSEGAIDEVLTAASGQTIEDGMIVSVANDQASVATFTSSLTGIPAFIIGKEAVKGTFTGLMSQCVIEVDSAHYVAGTYAAGDLLTATGGKFEVTTTAAAAIGKVLKFDATTGTLRVLWYESH